MSKPKKLRTLIKGARMGKPHAMYALGILHQTGRGMPQDLHLAALWIGAAAECGYRPAILWMRDYAFDDGADVQANA
jgi:TPR repeat protein